MFEIPENHVPYVLLAGGTNQKHFKRLWEPMVDEKVYKDMDNNSSRLGLPFHPVLVLIIGGTDGHLHSLVSLPLQKWQDGLRVEETVESSKNIQRVTDWVAGFMETFCMNNSISAVQLDTGKVTLGNPDDAAFSVEGILKDIRPKKDVRGLGMSGSIGSVDEILDQMSKPQIEKFTKKPKKTEAEKIDIVEKMIRLPVKDINDAAEAKKAKTKKEQQEIVDKYGFKALKDMTKRLKVPIVVDEPHA